MLNEKVTERVLKTAAEQGSNAFYGHMLMTENPFIREKNYKLWEAWTNGWLDAKLESNKSNKK